MATTSVSSDETQGGVPEAEPRSIYLRAYVPPPQAAASSRRGQPRRPSDWVLVFDTETWPDAAQNLRIGTYQLRKAGRLRDRGIFYDPDQVSTEELAALQREAPRHSCRLITVTEFREAIFFNAAYEADATIVGFNLPFDISRLAIDYDSARSVRRKDGSIDRSMAGGFTFCLSKNTRRPNVRIKHLSRRMAFIGFAQRWEKPLFADGDGDVETGKRPGFFLDLKTLASALTAKSFTLDTLAGFLGAGEKEKFSDFGRPLDPDFIKYAVQDAQVTWECYEALLERYHQHGLRQPAPKVFSEAGLGKAYLNEMKVRPWRSCQPDFPPEIIGAIISSYFGGRAEVRRRREIVPALYCDFASMYPSVCTLMDLWSFVIADGMRHEDWTDQVRAFLERVTLDDLQKPATWRDLTVLVQVQPQADIFPVRARYSAAPSSPDRSTAASGAPDPATTIGLNYLSADRPLWFTLADCIASKLLTGKAPQVVSAIRFTPQAPQDGLEAINIAGNPAYRVEPKSENFYKRVIDLRREVKDQLKTAKRAGQPQGELDRLDAEQLALKILANSTSYGIFIELNVEEPEAKGEAVTAYGAEGAFTAALKAREMPGGHFHPLLATLITGAARLMLAVTERLLVDEGLDWAFCDTDSMTFVPADGMSRAEFRGRVERICAWFEPLNPYEKAGSLLEFEEQNDDPATGKPRDLYCYAISAKRYALFNWDGDRPIVRKASAHGLGHLSPPYGNDDPDAPERDTGVHLWQEEFWEELIKAAQAAQAGGDEEIAWRAELDRPAASRYSATTPTFLSWFRPYNAQRPYAEKVRPFNFLLWFQAKKPHEMAADDPEELFDPRRRHPKPVAPFTRDLAKIDRLWDRETGDEVGPEWLRTYADVLRTYPVHSESKFLDGFRTQRGRTRRRHVFVDAVWNIGKEGDRFEEDSSLGVEEDPAVPYGLSAADRAASVELVRSGKDRFGVRALRKAAGVSDHTINAAIEPGAVPDDVLRRMAEAVRRLEAEALRQDQADAELLVWLQARATAVGVQALAIEIGVDAANLRKVLGGARQLSKGAQLRASRLLAAQAPTPG